MVKCTLVSILDKKIEDNCTGIYLETATGQRGVLKGHIPLVAALKENSLVRILKEDKEIKYIVGKYSFFQFKDNEGMILTQNFTETQAY